MVIRSNLQTGSDDQNHMIKEFLKKSEFNSEYQIFATKMCSEAEMLRLNKCI